MSAAGDPCGPLPAALPKQSPFSACYDCHRGDDADAGNLYLDDPLKLRAALADNPYFAKDLIERVRGRLDPATRERHQNDDPPYLMPPRKELAASEVDAIVRYVELLRHASCRR